MEEDEGDEEIESSLRLRWNRDGKRARAAQASEIVDDVGARPVAGNHGAFKVFFFRSPSLPVGFALAAVAATGTQPLWTPTVTCISQVVPQCTAPVYCTLVSLATGGQRSQ